ncbi:GntR family transcriptional regulator [Labrys monachus]|uniref:DNA-binding GntR family transcriptional regulator n=1 Tax=Labrys monachus TaxID=217067 RepID=A0ABU0FAF2_9HYPH|nr:GntR family transcriptional regulator [Labrys monachus]MDQ0391599.1 DNA-binding GntR family transcriptional regulator [Labrys monachus]
MGTKTDAQAARLIDAIKSDIIIGRLRPREHLVEDEISAKFQASRHIVRAALVGLEQMGLIIRRPNRGVVVRDFSVRQVEQIYEVRMILQAEAARRLPMPAAAETVAALKAIHADYCRAQDAGKLLEVNVLNDAFHRRIWQTCPNQYLADTIERLWVETTGIRWYGVGDPTLLVDSRKDHERMIRQLEAGDREGFVALAVSHILPPLEAFKRAHGAAAFGHPAGVRPDHAEAEQSR